MPKYLIRKPAITKKASKAKTPRAWKDTDLPKLKPIDLTKTIVHEDGEEHLGIIASYDHQYLIKDKDNVFDIGYFEEDADGSFLVFEGYKTSYSSLLDFKRVWKIN